MKNLIFVRVICQEVKEFWGLHFQTYPYSQTKLVGVSKGEILDLIVDIRKNQRHTEKNQIILNDTNHYQLLVPKGFAHGFWY